MRQLNEKMAETTVKGEINDKNREQEEKKATNSNPMPEEGKEKTVYKQKIQKKLKLLVEPELESIMQILILQQNLEKL